MNIKRHINFIVGFLFLAAALVLWAIPPNAATPSKADGALQVELDRVRAGDQRQGARFAGVTQAKNRAILSFAVPARVVQRPVTSCFKLGFNKLAGRSVMLTILPSGKARHVIRPACRPLFRRRSGQYALEENF